MKLEFHGVNNISFCDKESLVTFINENCLGNPKESIQEKLDNFCRNRDFSCVVENNYIKILKIKG